MKSITSLAALSTFGVFFLAANGCAVNSTGGESLTTDDDQLQTDQAEVDDADEVAATVIDDTTDGTNGTKSGLSIASGELSLLDGTADVSVDSEVDPSADPMQQADKARRNAGLFFKPAGCLTSTVSGNVVTHVFNNCTGARELAQISGTVVATWTRSATSIQVVRETQGDFKVGDATIQRKVTVTFSKEGTVYTKTRIVALSGSSEKGRTFSRDANWTLAYDGTSKCWTRDGSSSSDITGAAGGKRSFTTEVNDVKVCGLLKCPEAGGSISLAATKSKEDKTKTRSMLIEFLGDRKQRTTFTNAKGETKTVERGMFCRG